MPGTHVDDLVVLISDPESPRYGQFGKLTAHDWKESGDRWILFADGKEEIIPDTAPHTSQYYRHNDEHGCKLDAGPKKLGPRSFASAYLACGGSLGTLQNTYGKLFGEEFHDGRLI